MIQNSKIENFELSPQYGLVPPKSCHSAAASTCVRNQAVGHLIGTPFVVILFL